MLILAFLVLGAQDPDVDESLRRFLDPDPEIRESATRHLKHLGERALPGLKKASEGDDPELAARCKRLHRIISFEQTLSPELRQAMPTIGERLAFGTDADWTAAYLALADPKFYRTVHPLVRAELVPRAIRGAFPTQLFGFYAYIKKWDVREAIPALVNLVDERNRPEFDVVLNEPYDLLLEMRAIEAAPFVIKKLGNPKTRHLNRYIDLAVALEFREAVPVLVKRLETAAAWDRWKMVVALGALGDPAAVPALKAARKDKLEDIRWAAAEALVALGDPEGVTALREYMKVAPGKELPKEESLLGVGTDAVSYMSVIELLGERRIPELAPDLLPFCRHEDEHVVTQAARALCFQEAKGTEKEIARFLKDPLLVENAVWALCHLGATQHAAEIVKVVPDLGNSNNDYDRLTARLLTRDNWEVFKPLIGEDAAEPLVYAVRMAELGIEEAIPVLVGNDWDWEDVPLIHYALEKLDRKKVITALKELLKHEEEHLRGRGVVALAALSARESLDDVQKLREDPESSVRWAVLWALLGFGEVKEAHELFETIGPSYHSNLPIGDLGTLARAGSQKARQEIRKRAGARTPPAVALLAKLEGKEALPFLKKISESSDQSSQVEALLARARLGEKDLASKFLPLLGVSWSRRDDALDELIRLGRRDEMEKVRDEIRGKPEELHARLVLASRVPNISWTWTARNRLGSPEEEDRWAAANLLARAKALGPVQVERLLRDPYYFVREDAIRWITKADREGARETWRTLLKSRSSRARVHAASALALMGDASGADLLLGRDAKRNGIPLYVLNAARNPEAWKKLDRPVGFEMSDWRRKVESVTGLSVDIPADLSYVLRDGDAPLGGVRRRPFTARDAITYAIPRTLYDLSQKGHSFILEEDRIRILRRQEALAFWKRWNAERPR